MSLVRLRTSPRTPPSSKFPIKVRKDSVMASHHRQLARQGFTLVEVMISVALALLLMLAVGQIYSTAQQATGAGVQLVASLQSSRAIQARLTEDFRGMSNGASDSPGLVIVSASAPAFRNLQDKIQNRAAGDPTQANDPVGTGSLPAYTAITTNARIHRQDKFCFFVRNRINRQTGSNQILTSTMSGLEAFVWMGHLALPDNNGVKSWNYAQPSSVNYQNPGVPGSDNNEFASSWMLGREVILLAPDPIVLNGDYCFTGKDATKTLLSGTNPLSILTPAVAASFSTTASPPGPPWTPALNPNVQLYSSRYDVALTSIPLYRNVASASGTTTTPTTWWQDVSGTVVGGGVITGDRRYQANPFMRKPGTAATGTTAASWLSSASAVTAPVFVRGCTQFIVEFAGDFMSQNLHPGFADDGTSPVAGKQDGVVDYYTDPTDPQHVRHVLWYGAPRDVNGDGVVNLVNDVMPASTAIGQMAGGPVGAFAFERNVPAIGAAFSTRTSPQASQPYVCCWDATTDAAGIPRPRMIRITIAIDDPNSRLNTEQIYQYVYDLP
jgi:prepilin-type N-terminal cleavage/methylation domain-containing protein